MYSVRVQSLSWNYKIRKYKTNLLQSQNCSRNCITYSFHIQRTSLKQWLKSYKQNTGETKSNTFNIFSIYYEKLCPSDWNIGNM